jgi:predicted dehydrogenase
MMRKEGVVGNRKPIKAAVVGYGYWGPHMARNIAQIPEFELAAVADFSETRRRAVIDTLPGTKTFASLEEMLNACDLDAVVIATPPRTHHELASQCIERGLHVIVEKPLTTNVASARQLVQKAEDNETVLMVDHTYCYSSPVNHMKFLVENNSLGELVYFDSTRVNLGLFQPDVSVLWDLAVHDLAILQHVTGRCPVAVSASGGRHSKAQHQAATFLTLYFDDLFFAHINVSWLSPMKIRRTVLSGTEKTVLFDDMTADERIRIYEAGVQQDTADLLQYRLGEVSIPRLPNNEALRTELEHFRDCINDGIEPVTSAKNSLEIIAILESSQKSLDEGGTCVSVQPL